MCCHASSGAHRAQNVRQPTQFASPEVRKQKQQEVADVMEGLRADDMRKKVAKPVQPNSFIDKVKKAMPDVSAIIDDLKKKLTPGGEDVPPAASNSQPSAPNTSRPVRVV